MLQQIPDSGAAGCHSDLFNLMCGATLITSRPQFPAYLDLNVRFSAIAVLQITADDPQRSLHFPVQSACSLLRQSGRSVMTAVLLKEQRLCEIPKESLYPVMSACSYLCALLLEVPKSNVALPTLILLRPWYRCMCKCTGRGLSTHEIARRWERCLIYSKELSCFPLISSSATLLTPILCF